MINFRTAWPDEVERAAQICPNLDGVGNYFVAAETEPVERLVGAAFWRSLDSSNTPTSGSADFNWQVLPHYAGTPTEQSLLTALMDELSVRGRTGLLITRMIFAPDSPAASTLQAAGFSLHSANVTFRGSFSAIVAYQDRLLRSFGRIDRSGILEAEPNSSHAAALKALIARQESLMSPVQIDRALAAAAPDHREFDPEWSTLLLEAGSGRLIGAQLVRVWQGSMFIKAFAVDPSFRLVPGLGYFLVTERWRQLCQSRGWNQDFLCRVNPDENPVMFKLAGVLGYQEIARFHTYARKLRATG